MKANLRNEVERLFYLIGDVMKNDQRVRKKMIKIRQILSEASRKSARRQYRELGSEELEEV